MNISADEVRIALIAIAIGISIASLYVSRRSWLESNRPIITAFVSEQKPGKAVTTFNLVVSNTGNRPATHVRLHASTRDISSLVKDDAPDERKKSIADCFSKDATIPLLRNDEELETAFGAFSGETTKTINGEWLNYGAEIEVSIGYRDLEGRKFVSRLPLKIYVREGFGGHVWSERS